MRFFYNYEDSEDYYGVGIFGIVGIDSEESFQT